MDASQLYDEDFLLWTEQQADALRRLGGSNSLDIDHLAEEIEDLGKRDLRDAESFIELILLHCLKIIADPNNEAIGHWEAETIGFQSRLERRFTPSMRRKLDLERIWRVALRRFARSGPVNSAVNTAACALVGPPVSLEMLISSEFDITAFIEGWPTSVRHPESSLSVTP